MVVFCGKIILLPIYNYRSTRNWFHTSTTCDTPIPRPGPQNETKGLGMRPKGLGMRLPCQQCCNMRQVDVQEVVLSHDGREVGALHPFHHHQVDKAGQTKGRE